MDYTLFIIFTGLLQIIFCIVQSSGEKLSQPEFEEETYRVILKSHLYENK